MSLDHRGQQLKGKNATVCFQKMVLYHLTLALALAKEGMHPCVKEKRTLNFIHLHDSGGLPMFNYICV